MGAKSQIELILELKNRMKAKLNKAKAGVGSAVDSMKRKVKDGAENFSNTFKSKFQSVVPSIKGISAKNAEMFAALKDQIPFLGQFTHLLKNPYVLAAAAVVGLVLVMGKATKAAEEFSYAFLDIRQLNLDKPRAELDSYRDQILDLSYETGIAQAKMTQGFYDVQSATGLFGKDVASLNRQVANYSKATKADFNDSINSTTKAMKAFGFGVDQVTDFLSSNAKTVQVGITTFNELARVQTEFAGAAAGANQTFDTSNKIFAAFTAIAKDSTIAATLTKSALEGLTEDRTIKGLKQIGVNMFDAKGQIRSLDEVLTELTPKLQGMSDIQFLKFRNAIGGPEGLRNLMNTLKSSGDDVLKTFNAFDKSSFNMDQALANARNEAVVLKDEIRNKLAVTMTQIGNKILPVWTATLKAVNWLIDRIKSGAEFLYRIWRLNVQVVLNLWHGVKSLFQIIGEGVNWIYNRLGGEGNVWDRLFGTLDRWRFKIKVFFEDIGYLASNSFNLIEATMKRDMEAATKYLKLLRDFKFRDAGMLYGIQGLLNGNNDDPGSGAPGGTAPSTDGALPTDLVGGVGDARQVRNLTINIEAFNKDGIHVVKEGDIKSMSEEELERWFNQMMMRTIRNVETTVS